MDVLIVAAVTFCVALVAILTARRRSARREAEARERARRRRRCMPLVSANVRGLPQGGEDLWTPEARARNDRVA